MELETELRLRESSSWHPIPMIQIMSALRMHGYTAKPMGATPYSEAYPCKILTVVRLGSLTPVEGPITDEDFIWLMTIGLTMYAVENGAIIELTTRKLLSELT